MANDFLDYLHELFSGFASISTRAMFGGHAVYASVDGSDAVLIGIVIDEALYLKVDAQTRAAFEAAGCAPYVYTGQKAPITMSYWSVPEAALDSPQAMRPWARRAWEAALRKPVGRSRKPRRRPGVGTGEP